MFDAVMRRIVDPPLDRAGRRVAALGLGANAVTLGGFAVGLLAVPDAVDIAREALVGGQCRLTQELVAEPRPFAITSVACAARWMYRPAAKIWMPLR